MESEYPSSSGQGFTHTDLLQFDFYTNTVQPMLSGIHSHESLDKVQPKLSKLFEQTPESEMPPGFKEMFLREFNKFSSDLRAAENYWKGLQHLRAVDSLRSAVTVINPTPLLERLKTWEAFVEKKEHLYEQFDAAFKSQQFDDAETFLRELAYHQFLSPDDVKNRQHDINVQREKIKKQQRHKRNLIELAVAVGAVLLVLLGIWYPSTSAQLNQIETTRGSIRQFRETFQQSVLRLGQFRVPGLGWYVPVPGLKTLYQTLFARKHDQALEKFIENWVVVLIESDSPDSALSVLHSAQQQLFARRPPPRFAMLTDQITAAQQTLATETLLRQAQEITDAGDPLLARQTLLEADPAIIQDPSVQAWLAYFQIAFIDDLAHALVSKSAALAQLQSASEALALIYDSSSTLHSVPIVQQQIRYLKSVLADEAGAQLLSLAETYWNFGDRQGAVDYLLSLDDDIRAATSVRQQLAAYYRVFAQEQYAAAQAALAQNQIGLAHQHLQQAIEYDPTYAQAQTLLKTVHDQLMQENISQLLSTARVHHIARDYDKAINQLLQVIEIARVEGNLDILRNAHAQINEVEADALQARIETNLEQFEQLAPQAAYEPLQQGFALNRKARALYPHATQQTIHNQTRLANTLDSALKTSLARLLDDNNPEHARALGTQWVELAKLMVEPDRTRVFDHLHGWMDEKISPHEQFFQAQQAAEELAWKQAYSLLEGLPRDWQHPQLDQSRTKINEGLQRWNTQQDLLNQAFTAFEHNNLLLVDTLLRKIDSLPPDPDSRLEQLRQDRAQLQVSDIGKLTGPNTTSTAEWLADAPQHVSIRHGEILYVLDNEKNIARVEVKSVATLGFTQKMVLTLLDQLPTPPLAKDMDLVRWGVPVPPSPTPAEAPARGRARSRNR